MPQSDRLASGRKRREIAHGSRSASRATEIWGWSTPSGRRRQARRVGMLASGGRLGRGVRALELGAGTGGFTAQLALSGATVVGVDISLDLLRQASTAAPESALVIGDAERLPFPDGTFDAVVGSSVLHHLDPDAALAEAWRVLRPDGRVSFTEPNMLNPQIALQKNVGPIKRWAGDTPDETAFFAWELAARMRRAGFRDVLVEPFDFLHPAVPGMLVGAVEALARRVERLPIVRQIAGSLWATGTK